MCSPRSIFPRWLRSTFACSASASWATPRFVLTARTAAPNARATTGSAVVVPTGLPARIVPFAIDKSVAAVENLNHVIFNSFLAGVHHGRAKLMTCRKATRASRSPLLLVMLATLVAGCAALTPAEPAAWPDFVASFAGVPFESNEYPAGTTKVAVSADVPGSIESGNARFARWCAARAGTSGQVQQLARSNSTLSSFQGSLAAKSNAEQAGGLSFVVVSTVGCVGPANQGVIALMVSSPGRKGETEVKDGKVLSKLTRAFFTADQAGAFSAAYTQREAERTRLASARLQEREGKKAEATQRLRSNPRVGDRTPVGTIVEVRPPLVLVQYDERYRALGNRPAAEWLPIESLTADSP